MGKKRFICLLLVLAMCLSLMPITAMADEPPEEAPHQYLSSIAWNRSIKDTNQLYLKSDSPPYETFSFDPKVTKYEIMLVDAADANVDNGVQIIATLDEDTPINDIIPEIDPEKSFPMNGRFTDPSGKLTSSSMPGGVYKSSKQLKLMSGTALKVADNVKMNSDLYEVKFVTGYLTEGYVNQQTGVLSNTDTYVFNFYRRATLASFAAAYENGGDPISVTPAKFDPYETNLAVENVKAGTTKLHITAPAYTQADTALKFGGGGGTYIAGESDTTFTLDLTKYTPDKDGSITVPFMLDYTGSGSGVDGYYTLKISFAEEEVDYTPVFTSVSEDTNVKVGDDLTLSVEVEALDSDTSSSLSYQWYSSDSDTSEGEPIPGAAETAYNPATTSTGITYYTCEATRTVEDAEYPAKTEPIKVTVEEESPGDIYTPVFTSISEDAKVKVGDDLTLSVAVEALDSDTSSSLSYHLNSHKNYIEVADGSLKSNISYNTFCLLVNSVS